MLGGNQQWPAPCADASMQQQHRQQEEDAKSLRKQLQDAQCEAQVLTAENEQLMEMSNALRSERDRAGLVQNSPGYYPQQQQQHLMAFANQVSMQQPPISLPSAPIAQSHAQYVVQQGSSGFQHASQGQSVQPVVKQQPYQCIPQVPQPVVPAQGQGAFEQPHAQGDFVQPHGNQSSQNVVQQPAGQSVVLAGQQQVAPAQTCTDDSLPSEVTHYGFSLMPPLKDLVSRDILSYYCTT